MAKTEKKSEAAKAPANNIKFIGGGHPLAFINHPGDPITLPDAAAQTKGFYHADAANICAMFPDLYKPIIEKGS